MINAIYGKKIGMTQIFNEDDQVVPVTIIVAEPNKVCQVKNAATDGYEAVFASWFATGLPHHRFLRGRPFRQARHRACSLLSEVQSGGNASGWSTRPATQTVAAFADVEEGPRCYRHFQGQRLAGVIKRHGLAALKRG